MKCLLWRTQGVVQCARTLHLSSVHLNTAKQRNYQTVTDNRYSTLRKLHSAQTPHPCTSLQSFRFVTNSGSSYGHFKRHFSYSSVLRSYNNASTEKSFGTTMVDKKTFTTTDADIVSHLTCSHNLFEVNYVQFCKIRVNKNTLVQYITTCILFCNFIKYQLFLLTCVCLPW